MVCPRLVAPAAGPLAVAAAAVLTHLAALRLQTRAALAAMAEWRLVDLALQLQQLQPARLARTAAHPSLIGLILPMD